MRENNITKKYTSHLEALRGTFAYNFLKNIENHAPALWLSTHTNAHLYSYDRFILRIIFDDSQSIQLTQQPHINIAEETTDRTYLLFPKLNDIVSRYDNKTKWHDWHTKSGKNCVTIFSSAPQQFFDELYSALLVIADNPGP